MELLILIALLLLLILPTFMLNRRQRARMAEITKLQNNLKVGDRVVTTSGQHAIVADLRGDLVDLEIAPGIITTWEKISIVRVVPPAAPVQQSETETPPIQESDNN
ncbi:preprotein translocase subunit YajC [Corynebacterium pacaense]|uniref:preprotein translocase subunit YajC n=1 Tax=Corynebacterium pacaense TaxID=1816684 RepID=UPI0009BB7B3C|nr:preprotein translocase subunit YajC [Corynebacterium pacaense]